MEIIWIISLAVVHIGCFLAGAKVARWGGQKRTPRQSGPYEGDGQGGYPARTVRESGPYKGDGQGGNPARTVGDAAAHKEDQQQRRLQTLWHNIECYDGTAAGQREVEL